MIFTGSIGVEKDQAICQLNINFACLVGTRGFCQDECTRTLQGRRVSVLDARCLSTGKDDDTYCVCYYTCE